MPLRPARSFEHAVVLPVDRAQAFAWVSDPELLPRWMGGMVGLRWGRLPPDAVDRSFVIERSFGGRTHRHPADVVAWSPPERLCWKILQDQLTVHRDTRLSDEGGGTRVQVTLALAPVTVIARAGLPWFGREARTRLVTELDRLQRVVRAEAG